MAQRVVKFLRLLFISLFLFVLSRGTLGAGEERYQALETFAKVIYFLETSYFDPEQVAQTKLIRMPCRAWSASSTRTR